MTSLSFKFSVRVLAKGTEHEVRLSDGYSEERVKFAKAAGFTCLELTAGEGGPLDPRTNSDNLSRIKDVLGENGIAVSAIAAYQNHLEPGKEPQRAEFFRAVLEMAPKLGCNVVATMSGAVSANAYGAGDLSKSLDTFETVFSENARVAEANGVKIAFENWPGSPNCAYSPANWDALFNAVPSEALGLEYDPSHLARLMIDYIKPIKRFGSRIHHVHAKDTTMKTDVLNEVGYNGDGWWHYSIPGEGVVDWSAFFNELRDIGYNGDVDIEHEDPNYLDDKFDEGLHLGYKFCRNL
jgi:sugar phosphate isomerase/epimerase